MQEQNRMLSTLSGERAVQRVDTDSVHPATLSDCSLAALLAGTANPWLEAYAMATTGWQEEVATDVIPECSDRPSAR